jgi:hypothetical protein
MAVSVLCRNKLGQDEVKICSKARWHEWITQNQFRKIESRKCSRLVGIIIKSELQKNTGKANAQSYVRNSPYKILRPHLNLISILKKKEKTACRSETLAFA